MVEKKNTPVSKKWSWRALDCLQRNMRSSPKKGRKRERQGLPPCGPLSASAHSLSGNDTEGAVLLLGGVGGTWLKFAALWWYWYCKMSRTDEASSPRWEVPPEFWLTYSSESSPPRLCIFLLNFSRLVWNGTVQSVASGSNAICLRSVFVLIPIAISCDRHLACEDRFSFAVAAVLSSDSPVAVVALPELITLTSCSTPSHYAFKTAEGEPLGRVSRIMPAPCLSSPGHLISARQPPHALLWPPASETRILHCPREFALVGSYAWYPLLPNTNMTFFCHLFTQICPPSSQVFLVFWLNSSPRHVFPLPLFNFFLYDTHYY